VVRTDQIEGFILGDELSPEQREEIEQQLDNPGSEVNQIARRYARLTWLALDADGPLLGDPMKGSEK